MVTLHPETEDGVMQSRRLRNGVTDFGFQEIVPGPYTLTAASFDPEANNGVYGELVVTVQAGETHVDVNLRPAAWVEGVVEDASDRPLAGLEIHGLTTNRKARTATNTVRTGKDGRFRLRMAKGDIVEIRVENPSGDEAHTVAGIRAGTEDLVIRLQ